MRTEHHALNHAQRHAVCVEHRQHRNNHFVAEAGVDDPGPTLLAIRDEISVGQHRTFGHAGRSRGVQQDGDVGRCCLDGCAHRLGPTGPQHVQECMRPGVRGQVRHNLGTLAPRLGDG